VRRPRRHEPNATHLGSNGCRMREISRSVQIVKQAKKMCVDCIVRTFHMDADVAGPYDTWQGRMTCGRCWLAVVWMNWHLTHGMFVANGMVTRGPINDRHVSPGQWFKTYVVDGTQPRNLWARVRALGRDAQPARPPMVLNIYML
jgi:hypothetical protein